MLELVIEFSNLLAEEIGKERRITIPDADSINIQEFLLLLQSQPWSKVILENGYLKPSIVLIIDKEIIQFSNPSKIQITNESSIACHIMFAGGL